VVVVIIIIVRTSYTVYYLFSKCLYHKFWNKKNKNG
jgi:hypothetical protein